MVLITIGDCQYMNKCTASAINRPSLVTNRSGDRVPGRSAMLWLSAYPSLITRRLVTREFNEEAVWRFSQAQLGTCGLPGALNQRRAMSLVKTSGCSVVVRRGSQGWLEDRRTDPSR